METCLIRAIIMRLMFSFLRINLLNPPLLFVVLNIHLSTTEILRLRGVGVLSLLHVNCMTRVVGFSFCIYKVAGAVATVEI